MVTSRRSLVRFAHSLPHPVLRQTPGNNTSHTARSAQPDQTRQSDRYHKDDISRRQQTIDQLEVLDPDMGEREGMAEMLHHFCRWREAPARLYRVVLSSSDSEISSDMTGEFGGEDREPAEYCRTSRHHHPDPDLITHQNQVTRTTPHHPAINPEFVRNLLIRHAAKSAVMSSAFRRTVIVPLLDRLGIWFLSFFWRI